MEKKQKQKLLTMHKLEELIDNRLQKTPVYSQKPRVLPHNVHYVGRDDRLVILASLLLAQPKQLLNHDYQEPLLVFFRHGAAYRPDSPAECVQVAPRPLRTIYLPHDD